jgi:RNA polymerase sigma-54 factor
MQVKQQLRIKQQLGLTPQLQEAIRLMQLSAVELTAEIDAMAESNPLLEVEYFNRHGRIRASKFQSRTYQDVDEWGDEDQNAEKKELSLHDILLAQLNQQPLSGKDEMIGFFLLDAISAEGYLSMSCADISALLKEEGIDSTETEVEKILTIIQSFDPPGVGARDLSECLVLQLQKIPLKKKIVSYAQKILAQNLSELLGQNKKSFLKQCGLEEAEFELGMQLIKTLNPRPGADYVPIMQHYQEPDLIVRKEENKWIIEFNQDVLPRVSINQQTLKILNQSKVESDRSYRNQRLKEAKWLIKSLEKREQTLISVVQEVVNRQQGFLERGPLALRPLTLGIIANAVDKHESTVSRITAEKTILTPQGLFELKYFFSSQLNTHNGTGVSSTAIRSLIQKLIAEEDPSDPYSDHALTKIMKEQGICIARRTISKYRESMGILASFHR